MDALEKLTELLTNKAFYHNGKEYYFLSCKKVMSNIMILTNKETIQIPVDRFADFYDKVKDNCIIAEKTEASKGFVPSDLPVKKDVFFIPEMPNTYQKLNNSFDNLIDAIDSATGEDLKLLECKAKILTSLAQQTVNMTNSSVGIAKLFQNK